jgi:hypothetical protein
VSEETPHKQRRCNGCREWIDIRAAECYLCGAERDEPNTAAVNAAHAERMNAHLFGEGNAARRDHAATRNIPTSAKGVGPSGNAYAGARGYGDLVKHFKSQLREAGVGE